MNRPTWSEYFLGIAQAVSARASCPRASVGAILVRENRVLATGYNGAPAGEPHCIDRGCIVKRGHCTRAVHAEVNAVAQAARHGVSVSGATVFVWDSKGRKDACPHCQQVLTAAGVTYRVVSGPALTVAPRKVSAKEVKPSV